MSKALITFFMILFVGLGLFIGSQAHGKNFQPVICTEDPNPEQCESIVRWYQSVILPEGQGSSSCCGLGDAYWFETDSIDSRGLWATIHDDRQIPNRKMRDGEKIFIPFNRLDNRFQGNPTGHSVVFLGQAGALFPDGNTQPGYPWVYCAFPDLPG